MSYFQPGYGAWFGRERVLKICTLTIVYDRALKLVIIVHSLNPLITSPTCLGTNYLELVWYAFFSSECVNVDN